MAIIKIKSRILLPCYFSKVLRFLIPTTVINSIKAIITNDAKCDNISILF